MANMGDKKKYDMNTEKILKIYRRKKEELQELKKHLPEYEKYLNKQKDIFKSRLEFNKERRKKKKNLT